MPLSKIAQAKLKMYVVHPEKAGNTNLSLKEYFVALLRNMAKR